MSKDVQEFLVDEWPPAIRVVSERLGHANIAITLDRCSHVLPLLQEDGADKSLR